MTYEEKIKEHEARRRKAEAMGGADKLAKRQQQGFLNARERVDRLLDPASFHESGRFGVSYIKEMREETPADGKVCGFGEVDGRPIGVVSYDFTVKGSSSSATNNKKMSHIKDIAAKRGFPVVFLSEFNGHPDARCDGRGNGQYERGWPFLAVPQGTLGFSGDGFCLRFGRLARLRV